MFYPMETTVAQPELSQINQRATRIQSLDILRGIVMVLMAIDHVRVYSGLPPGGSTAGIFFTRWITHFCAPSFVFLAGTSAFFYGLKVDSKPALIRFLLTRGFFLVILEITVIRFFWTFSLDYSQPVLAGVIWMLGWCMIILAGLIRLKPTTIGIIGLVLIFGQQLFGFVPKVIPAIGPVWEFIYPARFEPAFGMTVLYVLVPWIGVMCAGYAFGEILRMEPSRRNKICRWIGIISISLWLIIGTIVIFTQEASTDSPPFIFQLLNQRKYPASQLYLFMTLGPLILLVPAAEKMKGAVANIFRIIGRVPLFYYLLHIPLIHLSAFVVQWLTNGQLNPEWYLNAPYVFMPEENRWSLGMLYLVFAIDVTILYFACKAYATYKFQHPENAILKYI
jgi:uncharacterized membrane protein